MRVAIDSRALAKTGMRNYSDKLLALLPQVSPNVETIAYVDNLKVNRENFHNKYVNLFRRIVGDQVSLPSWAKEKNIDIFHNPRNMGIPFSHSFKVVTTIHDVIPRVFPQYYLSNKLEQLYYATMLRMVINRSDSLITISEFSKRELLKYYQVPEDKITVIPQACSEAMRVIEPSAVQAALQKYNITRPYIMTIGGSEYRKNVKTVIEAYLGELGKDYALVVVGGAWRNLDLRKDYANCKSLKFVQGISDEDLIALYNGAEAFIFASFYEGFGLPLLEAMRCGTPVIAARASCLPEVSGDAAKYFSPLDSEELRHVLQEVLGDRELQQAMIKKGFARQQLYSWEKTAAATYEVYKKVLVNDGK